MTEQSAEEKKREREERRQEMRDLNHAHRMETINKIWSRDDTGHDLTIEEQLFVRSYIIDRNPVAALRRLDYADPPARLKLIATRYLSNPEVQGAVDSLAKKMMANLEVTAERVNARLAAMAFFDPRGVMQFDGHSLRVLDSSLWSDAQIASIAGIKMTKDAGVEIKFVDPLRAVEILGKQLGTLKDETAEAARLHAEAAANAAIQKISEVFERVMPAPSNPVPVIGPPEETIQ